MLNKRLTGAVVLVALAVIFVPMLFEDKGKQDTGLIPLIPERPDDLFFDDLLPVDDIAEVPVFSVEEEERYALPAGEVIQPPLASDALQPPAIVPAPELTPEPVPEITAPAVPDVLPDVLPVTPPARAPAPSAVSGAGWVVQAGSFGQNTNAENLRQKLADSGRDAFIEPYEVGERTLYRVRVGPFADRAVAEAELSSIESAFQLKGSVHSFP